MNLGIIGCGWIVEFGHMAAIRLADEVTVVAVADASAVRAKSVGHGFGVADERCLDDWRGLLEIDEVDAVLIATPPTSHREIATAAAEAGKHVLCEKPMAPSLDDADAIIAAGAEAGVVVGLCHNCLWFPEHIEARRQVEAGMIGAVIGVEASSLGAEPWPGASEFAPGWRRDVHESGGGVLMDEGVHSLYLIESYVGHEIDAVSAMIRVSGGLETWTSCALRLGADIGTLNIAWGEGVASLQITGTDGYIEFVYDEGVGSTGFPARVLRTATASGEHRSWLRPWNRRGLELVFPGMYEDFVAAVNGGFAYPATAADGRRILEAVLAAYTSHNEGRVVGLPLTESNPAYQAGVAMLGSGG
jgi:predicted dehydrogenase